MKLTTENGQLDLPRDFSIEMERTNPFLSDEGDASVPTTLPATKRNLQVLDHIERIDRVGDNLVDIPAVLQVGSFNKHGRLMVDTAHCKEGINVSFAIENSSLYCQYKDKTIKQIFGEFNHGIGYRDDVHTGLANIITHLENIYRAQYAGVDYTIFPVGVAKYQDDGHTYYQVNNEFSDHTLIYQSRVVREGDIRMTVPDGYGVSPFIRLHRMLAITFNIMGYTVAQNYFNAGWMSNIVVLNNYSDTIVNGVINYKDLVPSCTLSELLMWLKEKFHVHVRVDSEDKRVSIVSMEDILAANADTDYSENMEGDLTLTFNKTSRTVLSSGTNIEGAKPAAETFDKLIEKYGGFFTIPEGVYQSMMAHSFQYHDCLVFRKATGGFYEIRTNMNTGLDELTFLGTNYFKYDRANSDETEEYVAIDEMPPMIVTGKLLVPYIGERKHAHTTYNNSETDDEQPIILVQEWFPSSYSYYQLRVGTTQGVVPLNDGDQNLQAALVNYQCFVPVTGTKPMSIYNKFWTEYNKQLRNGIVEVTAALMLKPTDLSGLDMTKLKLLKNQKLLPKSFTIPIGEKQSVSECHFFLIKDNASLIEDADIVPATPQRVRWNYQGSVALDDLWATLVLSPYQGYDNLYGSPIDNGLLYDRYMMLINPINYIQNPETPSYIAKPTNSYVLEFTDGIDTLYSYMPQEVGLTSPAVVRYFTMRIEMGRFTYDANVPDHFGTFHDNFYIDFPNQSAVIQYVSQAY